MSSQGQSLTQKTASGVAWSAVFQITRQLCSFASVTVLARFVPPSGYGLIAMAAIVTAFVDAVRDLGTSRALVREPAVSERLLSSVFWLNLFTGILLTSAVAAVAYPAAAFFHEPKLIPVMQVLSLIFLFSSSSVVHYTLLNRDMDFRSLMLSNLAGAVIGAVSAIAAALLGAGVWSLVVGNLMVFFVPSVGFWLACSWRPQWLFDWKEIRSIGMFSLNASGFSLVNYFSTNMDNLLVGKFIGDSALGLYQMSYTLMTYPIDRISFLIASALMPAFSSIQNDHIRFRSSFSRACALVAMVTFPAMLGLAVLAGPFIDVVLGSRWHPVAPLLLIFAPLGMFQSISLLARLIYYAKGRSDWLLRWSLFCGVLYVASFVIGIRWGIGGVAAAYAITWMLLMIPGFSIPFRLIGLSWREFLAPMWPVIQITLLMTLASAAWRVLLTRLGIHHPAVHLFSTAAVGCAVYIGLFLLLRPAILYELARILKGRGYSFLARLLAHSA
ncbi:MAG: MOP flippase family protein [Bryobacteraceae bacterium]